MGRKEIDWANYKIGIPCKYTEVAVIPKHIWEYFSDGEWTAICRGGEMVKLELLKEYDSDDAINADLSAMFGIGIVEYTSLWKKRVDALELRKNGWVKVKMNKIEPQEGENAIKND